MSGNHFFFFWFEKYLYIVCLKMVHLGRVTNCFETLLLLCKLAFFNYTFHKNIRRQKRFVSKQGQPRPHTQLKARLLTEQLKNGLFLRLHYSVHYYRLAILPIAILTLFVKYVFPSQICAIPLQPYLYSSGSCFILHRFKTHKTNKQYKMCHQWFPQCSGYHVRLTRGRSPVQIWSETLNFFV